MKMEVANVSWLTSEVCQIVLKHPKRPTLPPWNAGAHVDVHLPNGRIRQYSLCGDPNERETYRIAVKYEAEGRGGSSWIHNNVRRGDTLPVSAPRNNFPLEPEATRYVFVAGGIGITPIMAMAYEALAEGKSFELHYCARSWKDAPFLSEIEELCGNRIRGHWSNEERFSVEDLFRSIDEESHIYACGPKRLTDAVRRAASEREWKDGQLHFEVFEAVFDENFKPEPFDVKIESTGQVVRVPADQTMIEVLREQGYPMPSSCELGVCGACVCTYKEGVVIHRDSVLSPVERQSAMTPCISRARGSVTIDI